MKKMERTPADSEKESGISIRLESKNWTILSGIGEVLAGRIVEYREQNGSFRRDSGDYECPWNWQKYFEGY